MRMTAELWILLFCVPSAASELQNSVFACVAEVSLWMRSNGLQLIPAKTEILWFTSSRRQIQILQVFCKGTATIASSGTIAIIPRATYIICHISVDTLCHICVARNYCDCAASSSVLRDLGIYHDSNLSMTALISKTASNCFSAMRLIRSVRRSVSKAVLLSLVTALVLSRVDYGNATLAGLPARQLCRLQSVLYAAAQIVFSAQVRSRDTTALWTPLTSDSGADHLQSVVPRLPVSQRHSTCVSGRQHQPRNWRHHEAESALQLINGGRCSSDSLQHDRGSRFSGCCCPRMEQPTSFVTLSSSLSTFKSHLKTHLFSTSY